MRIANLNIRKRRTYNGQLISNKNSSEVFRIGIYIDKECTKLLKTVDVRVPKGSGIGEKTIQINLYVLKTKNKEITLYFKELQVNEKQYKPSLSVESITLNNKTPSADLVVTNEAIAGSSIARDMSGGGGGGYGYGGGGSDYAIDSEGIAREQSEANAAAYGAATGDTSPIGRMIALLGGSAAVILLLVLLILRRRKK